MTDTVTITLPLVSDSNVSVTAATPSYNMIIVQTDGNNRFVARFAPREVQYQNWGRNWTEVPRDGKIPYLVMESQKLPKMSFTMTLANPTDPDYDLTGELLTIKRLSNATIPLKITYGGYFESNFLWRMTNLNFSSVYRNTSNQITQAEIDLEFTMLQDVVLATGPVTGGVTTPKPKPKKKTKTPTKKSSSKTKIYIVKKGDTLHKIAIKVYHNAAKWRHLGDLNHIKGASQLHPGMKLKY